MKKKLLLTLMTTVGLIVVGCGNTNVSVKDTNDNEIAKIEVTQKEENEDSNSETMKFSEMLNSIISEKGEVTFYEASYATVRKDKGVIKDTKVYLYSYDGNNLYRYLKDSADGSHRLSYEKVSLGKIVKDGEENVLASFEKDGIGVYDSCNEHRAKDKNSDKVSNLKVISSGLAVKTDGSGNNVVIEGLFTKYEGDIQYKYEEEDRYTDPEHFESVELFPIGGFGRVQIYNQTFMVFKSTEESSAGSINSIKYIIIPDTDTTRDKEIILDDLSTQNIEIDTIKKLKKYHPQYVQEQSDVEY